MIFRSKQGFWARRGISSIVRIDTGKTEDQAMQRLPDHLTQPAPKTEASATPWSTLHNTPPSEEEGRQ